MQAVVQTEGVSKDYDDITAVAELDLVVEHGQRVALVGHPGSGKTTLLRMLVDLVHPTTGRIRVAGYDTRVAPYQVRRRVGWVPNAPTLPQNLSVAELLDRLGEFKRSGADTAIRSSLLPSIDVAPDDPMSELDDAEQYVVAFVAALEKQPELLLLDEPLAAAGRFRDLVADTLRNVEPTVTVVASARDLTLTDLFDRRVLFIERGRIIADGSITDLRMMIRQRTELTFSSTPDEAGLRSLPGVLDLVVQGSTARMLSVGPTDALIDAARPLGLVDAVVHEAGLDTLIADHTLLASNR